MRDEGVFRMRAVRTGLVTLTLLGTLAFGTHAYADDPDAQKHKVDQHISQLQDDLDDTSAALIAANNKLNATNAQVAAATKALQDKQAEVVAAQNNQRDIAAQLQIADANEAQGKADLSANAAAQTKTRALVGGIARQSYMSGGLGSLGMTLNLLTSNDTTDLTVADVVMRQQGQVLSGLTSQRAAQQAAQDRISAAKRRVAQLKIDADNALTRANAARDAATKARNDLVALQKTQAQQKADLEKQKSAELANLKQEQAESARLSKVLAARAAAAKAAAAKNAALRARAAANARQQAAAQSSGDTSGLFLTPPMPVSTIRSGFGMRLNPVLHIWLMHEGDDFPFPCGTPVYAAAAGTVISTSYDPVAGNHVVIDHGLVGSVDLGTWYAHLSKFATTPGTSVKKGQLIGYSGTTGRSTGCHLHFAVMEDGRAVNPLTWLT
ncbi:M23 family metallopeptidase [Branchiibius sp. NY16-3462-2]|uniref:M23 family metallopeptidase n=1 Tax=Branchiibius sp. NY16-3462-2 TaxID=1807500 RepID=UPI000B2DB4F6|nr:M23 family metallopeptidase [Branchiibius sp. NY16-3462-2]